MNSTQFLTRKSPSGHTYRLHAAAGEAGTNGFLMTNGMVIRNDVDNQAFYLSVSNQAATLQKPWNLQGVAWRYRSNNTFAAPFELSPVLLRANNAVLASASSDFMHAYWQVDQRLTFQRGLIETLHSAVHNEAFNAQNMQEPMIWEVATFTNSVVFLCNGFVQSIYYTNLAFCNYKVHMWELLNSATNSHTPEMLSIWSGYADPALEILANTHTKLGSNNVPLVQLSRPTLLGAGMGSYTNTTFDSYVGIPNALAGAGAGRTNRLPIINNDFGRIITVYDEGKTAAGTNVWVSAQETINRGPTQTNITVDAGSITLMSTPFGWQILSRFP